MTEAAVAAPRPTARFLGELFERELAKLKAEIGLFPSDAQLWQTLPGVTNTAGNLTLHLEGNLRAFIGAAMGGIAYTRDRDHEFAGTGYDRANLAARIEAVAATIPPVIAGLSDAPLATVIEPIPGRVVTTEQFLLHLYGHLTYHLGQINYLRRILTGAVSES